MPPYATIILEFHRQVSPYGQPITLIVYAHQEPTSFDHALLNTAIETLTAAGHEVAVPDLYAKELVALSTRADFVEMRDAQRFGNHHEKYYAGRTNTIAPDIAVEIDNVRHCDTLIMQFRLC